jgi:hypothetical protein
VRYSGIGAWEGKADYWGCPYCKKRKDGTDVPVVEIKPGGIIIIDKVSVARGESISVSHLQNIRSRVVDDEGNNLSEKKGIEYMKSKGDKYVGRLKAYYDKKV